MFACRRFSSRFSFFLAFFQAFTKRSFLIVIRFPRSTLQRFVPCSILQPPSTENSCPCPIMLRNDQLRARMVFFGMTTILHLSRIRLQTNILFLAARCGVLRDALSRDGPREWAYFFVRQLFRINPMLPACFYLIPLYAFCNASLLSSHFVSSQRVAEVRATLDLATALDSGLVALSDNVAGTATFEAVWFHFHGRVHASFEVSLLKRVPFSRSALWSSRHDRDRDCSRQQTRCPSRQRRRNDQLQARMVSL